MLFGFSNVTSNGVKMKTAQAYTIELTRSNLIQSLRQYYLDQVCGLAYASQPLNPLHNLRLLLPVSVSNLFTILIYIM